MNFAAESHVDRSISDATPFLRTNVVGTQCLLDAARAAKVPRFVQVSTDEVYGTLRPDDPPFSETTPLAPNSPYAASKAGADLLVRAAYHTFGLDTVITRCSNNYGPYQFPEKLIPLFITNAMAGIPVPVYGDGRQMRDWIYVLDHCRGIDAALRRGRAGEVYNFGGKSERYNLDVTRTILELCGKSESLIQYVTDRPGHDRRYAINCAKAESELGWQPDGRLRERLGRDRRLVQRPCRLDRTSAIRGIPLSGESPVIPLEKRKRYPPMRALVTGISGFVGGHLTEHLVAQGDLVVGLSVSGRWPLELEHLGKCARIERLDLVDCSRGRPGRLLSIASSPR